MVDYRISYCLSETAKERCKLQFSLPILLVVLFFNVVKATCMIITVRAFDSPTLLTIGDAINSFLRVPDTTTKTLGIAGKADLEGKKWLLSTGLPRKWSSTVHRWFTAASVKRWLSRNVLYEIHQSISTPANNNSDAALDLQLVVFCLLLVSNSSMWMG